MEISELPKLLGIATYVFIILTFLAGLFLAKLKLKLKPQSPGLGGRDSGQLARVAGDCFLLKAVIEEEK